MALAYPNDRDGGANRLATIRKLETKIKMAAADGDESRVSRYTAELVEARDATKPLLGTVLVN